MTLDYSSYGTTAYLRLGEPRLEVVKLFQPLAGADISANDAPLDYRLITVKDDAAGIFYSPGSKADRDVSTGELSVYKPGVKRGFVKLELNSSFYHNIHSRLISESTIANTVTFGHIINTSKATDEAGKIAEALASLRLPKAPYTPQMRSVVLDYKSSVDIDVSVNTSTNEAARGKEIQEKYENRVEQFFHLTPFGSVEIFPAGDAPIGSIQHPGEIVVTRDLVPQFDSKSAIAANADINDPEGTLLIGIKDLNPPQNLTLYFALAEGTENTALEPAGVIWSFLVNNQWVPFMPDKIVMDTTNGLVNTGIITFELSSYIDIDNSVLPEGLHWIRASVPNNLEAFSDVIEIRTQSAQASFFDKENAADRIAEPVEGGTISKLVLNDFAIKTIEQPLPSFGGRVKEQSQQFYGRVSERISHKQRAVTISDYERIVLEEFNDILKVKCINHMDPDTELSPGSVTIVVIPYPVSRFESKNIELRAGAGRLESIERYLRDIASPFIQLDVRNPSYEQVQLSFAVDFLPGFDRRHYEKQLQLDIQKFLAPWAFGEPESIKFGGEIKASAILNHIEELPYVDYITEFTVKHYHESNPLGANAETVKATTSASILVAHTNHIITEPNNSNC